MTLLHPIKYNWYAIGEQLKVDYGDIKSAEYNMAYDDTGKLSEVLQVWINKRTCQVDWKTIVTVIEEKPIENKVVANEIYQFLTRPDIQNEYLPSHDHTGKMISLLINCSFVITLDEAITTFNSPLPIPQKTAEKKGTYNHYCILNYAYFYLFVLLLKVALYLLLLLLQLHQNLLKRKVKFITML